MRVYYLPKVLVRPYQEEESSSFNSEIKVDSSHTFLPLRIPGDSEVVDNPTNVRCNQEQSAQIKTSELTRARGTKDKESHWRTV